MPDAGFRPRAALPGPPADWSAAFAALPLESPDPGRTPRVPALPAARHARWPAWGALAAMLALAAFVSWRSLPVAHAPSPAVATGERDAPAPTGTTRPSPSTADAHAVVRADAGDAHPAQAASPATPSPDSAVATRDDAATPAQRAAPRPDTGPPARTRLASVPPGTRSPAPRTPAPAEDRAELERLYAESARLEALVALARDDRVASGTDAVLSSVYDTRVADIDAALVQPDVTPARRTALWRERVAAMRELAGFESTRRLLAAQGERYDARLVSVD